jgi:oligopeptide transport system substrate-binding protein
VTLAVPHTKLEVYTRERPAELHRTPLAETRYLAFNMNRPALADPRVRQALAAAIDRQKIVDRVLLGGQLAARTFVPPVLRAGGGAGSESQPHLHAFAPTEARRLFFEAGYGPGRAFPKLELSAWSRSQAPVLEAIQAMWRETLGIETTIAIREAKVHLAALRGADYDIAFVTTLLDVLDPVALLDGFTTGAADNFPHWRDSEYDAAIARAGKGATREALWTELDTAETRLLTAAPVTPIYFNVRNYLLSPRVQGWQEDALWTRYYLNLTIHEN